MKIYSLEELKQKFPGDWILSTINKYYYIYAKDGNSIYIDYFIDTGVWRLEQRGDIDVDVSEKEVKEFYKKHFKMKNFQ